MIESGSTSARSSRTSPRGVVASTNRCGFLAVLTDSVMISLRITLDTGRCTLDRNCSRSSSSVVSGSGRGVVVVVVVVVSLVRTCGDHAQEL